jgi:uncharacterized membrane-anchored protein
MKKKEEKFFWEGILLGGGLGIIGNIFVTSAFNLIVINKYLLNFLLLIVSFIALVYIVKNIIKIIENKK